MSSHRSKNHAYLTEPEFCQFNTALALGATLMAVVVVVLCLWHGLSMLLKMEFANQLKILFEFSFLLACITALWKHAFRS